jgi:hypothetical protein
MDNQLSKKSNKECQVLKQWIQYLIKKFPNPITANRKGKRSTTPASLHIRVTTGKKVQQICSILPPVVPGFH